MIFNGRSLEKYSMYCKQNYDKIFLKDEQILKLKISKDETLQLAMFAKLNSYNMNVMKIIEFAIKVNKMRF